MKKIRYEYENIEQIILPQSPCRNIMATAKMYDPFMGKSKMPKPMTTVNVICTINKKVMLIICEMINSVGVMPTMRERSKVPRNKQNNYILILSTF